MTEKTTPPKDATPTKPATPPPTGAVPPSPDKPKPPEAKPADVKPPETRAAEAKPVLPPGVAAAPAKPAVPPATPAAAAKPATPPPAAPPSSSATAPDTSRSAPKALTLLGFALLAAGFVWLVTQQQDLGARLAAAEREAIARADVQEGQIRALQQRLTALESRPAPTPAPAAAVNLGPLEARLAALEGRPAAGPAADLRPVEGRIAALEQRPVPAPAPDPGPRLEALTARIDRLARLPAAITALAAQEVALRNDFAEVARTAESVSTSDHSDKPALERMWLRAQALVTVRDGDTVLAGPPAAPALARARVHLASGDVVGALAALDKLDPAAAQATAAWRTRAKALVEARAALAKAGE